MAPEGDGFIADSADLRSIRFHLFRGAGDLDDVTGAKPRTADAGDSSEDVAKAITRLQKIGVALAQKLDDTGHKVDRADGAYAEIENTTEGSMKVDELYPPEYLTNEGRGPGAHLNRPDGQEPPARGPLLDAPVSETAQSRDGEG